MEKQRVSLHFSSLTENAGFQMRGTSPSIVESHMIRPDKVCKI